MSTPRLLWTRVELAARGAAPLFGYAVLPQFREDDGVIRVLEFDDLPFTPARQLFQITEVPRGRERGGHAHRAMHEMLIATVGAMRIAVAAPNGETSTVDVAPGGAVIWAPPHRWIRVLDMEPGAVLTCIVSTPYDPADYVHDREEFAALAP